MIFTHDALDLTSSHQLSALVGSTHVTIIHDALDLTIHDPPQSWPPVEALLLMLMASGGKDRRSVQTCSLETPPGADIWWLVIEAYMVGGRAVCIILECLLVVFVFVVIT